MIVNSDSLFANVGKLGHGSNSVTWFIGAVFTVTVVVVHLLKGDDFGPIDAQEGLPLPVEPLVCYRTEPSHTDAG